MVDWETVLSVILGLFLFNFMRNSVRLLVGFLTVRRQKVGSIDTSKPRGTFLH